MRPDCPAQHQPGRPLAPDGSGWRTFRRTPRRWTCTCTPSAIPVPEWCCGMSPTAWSRPMRRSRRATTSCRCARRAPRRRRSRPVSRILGNAGDAYTVAGIGPHSRLRVQVLKDTIAASAGQALVRVIQASLRQHDVTVTLGGLVLARKLEFQRDVLPCGHPRDSGHPRRRGQRGRALRTSRCLRTPSTRWWCSTAEAACASQTWSTRPAARSRPAAAPPPDWAAPHPAGPVPAALAGRDLRRHPAGRSRRPGVRQYRQSGRAAHALTDAAAGG